MQSKIVTEPVPEEVIELECDSGMMMVNGQCEIMQDTLRASMHVFYICRFSIC